MENKYYTPEIEDIRVGYECEINKGILPSISEGWYHYMIPIGHHIINIKGVRVPYLTKEQIEAEGWTIAKQWHTGTRDWTLTNHQRLFKLIDDETGWMVVLLDNNKIEISNTGECRFYGECKSINEFRYICKLLGI